MLFRRVSAFATAAFLACLTTGCERHSKSETYYLVAVNLKLPYWQQVAAGFNKAAAQYIVTPQLRGPDNFDPQAELDAFQKAVATKPAGILVSVSDANLLGPAINDAISAGIPVVTMDSDAQFSHRLFFIGTNNLQAGRLGGERLAKKLDGKGNVVFFSMPGQPNLDERLRGYLDAFAEHPGIKVVDVFNIKGDTGFAFDQAQQFVARTGKDTINAFVCLESAAGKEVAEVLRRANAKDRVLMAMDVNPDTLELIKSGNIEATISQKPWTMGYVGLRELDIIHHDKPTEFRNSYAVDSFAPYPNFIDTGTSLVDKENVQIYIDNAAQAKK
jgi:ribose transport system substrate-binding protein